MKMSLSFLRKHERKGDVLEAIAPIIDDDKNIPLRIALTSFLPYAIDTNELLPRHKPIITDVRNVISVYDEPTAASALSPTYRPTTHVSTRL